LPAAIKYEITIDPDIYNQVYYPYLERSWPTEIFFGGSSSGKSIFATQRAVEEVMQGGHNYLCLRKNANSVGKSVFNEIEKAISRLKARELFDIVPSQGHITCKNGYQFLFAGLDDVEKIKSITPKEGVITDILIEEATETAKEDFKQLKKRLRGIAIYKGKRIPKRVIMLFNPIYKTHWIYVEFFKPVGWSDSQTEYHDENISILKTTHIDNDFLDPEDHAHLENETDPYWRNVYTLGNWGTLGDLILKNWRVADLSDRSQFINIRNGLDFGYASDPNAFIRSHYDAQNKKIYAFSGWSQGGMTNPQIADRLKPDVGSGCVFCDSAEPKSIQELIDFGVDARGVKKGPDSVLFSIKWLQKHEIIVDDGLQGLANELSTWQWKKDKNGNSLPIPVDKDDHYIAALRYAHEIDYSGFFAGVL